MPKVTCLGLACLDYLFLVSGKRVNGVKKASGVKKWLAQGGGMAATAAVTAARLGAEVRLVTKIGDDEIGKRVWKGLEKEGVQMDEFSLIKGAVTPVDFIKVLPDGFREFYYFPGRNLDRPAPEDISADVLLLDEAYFELSLETARMANQKGIIVLADLEAKIGKEEEKLLKFVDHAIFDKKAAREMDPDIQKAVKKLKKKVDLAAVTCGEEGIFYSIGKKVRHQPAFDVKVVDTTGAGDVLHGAYAYALANKWPPRESLRFSSAAAALACRKLGGRSAIPTLKEVIKFLDEQEN